MRQLNTGKKKSQPKIEDWCMIMAGEIMDQMVNKGVSGADKMKLQTAEALEEAARRLRSTDISKHGEDVKKILHDVEARVNQFKGEAGMKFHEMEGRFHDRMEPVETLISDHPIPAVLIAMGVGFLFGMLISKSHD
ncbi:MAG TPA: hypothetical protein VMS81_00260 [Methanomicrobiales archaeon]|nr:hypothetical protein [Methanomicrobiales archaeon]